jgi:HSP20 family protein
MAALIRWSPERMVAVRPWFRPYSLLEEVEEMARRAFEPSLEMDMYEEGKELVIKADLPGIKRKDIDISVEGDVLTIKAEKKAEKERKEGAYYYSERECGTYERCMTLPTRVDADKISANLKKGVLEIRLPKAEAPETKKIEVTTK